MDGEDPFMILNGTAAVRSPHRYAGSLIGYFYHSIITQVRLDPHPGGYGTGAKTTELLNVLGKNVIILATFYFVGLCLGIGSFIWAGLALARRRRGGGSVSALVIGLLLSDLLELLMLPAMATLTLDILVCFKGLNCLAVLMQFGAARQCGYCLHQWVALEGVLAYRSSKSTTRLSSAPYAVPISLIAWELQGTTRLSSAPYAVPISLIAWLWGFLCNAYFANVSFLLASMLMSWVINGFTGLLAIATAITAALAVQRGGGRSSSEASEQPRVVGVAPRSRWTELLPVLGVSWCTLVLVYGPSTVWYVLAACGVQSLAMLELYFTSVGLMTLRLVTDPLLCVLVVCHGRRNSATVAAAADGTTTTVAKDSQGNVIFEPSSSSTSPNYSDNPTGSDLKDMMSPSEVFAHRYQ
ncbi:uncharacterized protein LOC134437425 [Engraulis encrasicolus]|uniref:uncharacterized protein LOC134437425 n=1 Tax=Engraulis encrasicolus TaxID=184585 RepID=UPI002FCFB8BE